MLRLGRYQFKLAETDSEFEQVHRLNTHCTGILAPAPARGLGQFHDKNTYILAIRAGDSGMLAHSEPLFRLLPGSDLSMRNGPA